MLSSLKGMSQIFSSISQIAKAQALVWVETWTLLPNTLLIQVVQMQVVTITKSSAPSQHGILPRQQGTKH